MRAFLLTFIAVCGLLAAGIARSLRGGLDELGREAADRRALPPLAAPPAFQDRVDSYEFEYAAQLLAAAGEPVTAEPSAAGGLAALADARIGPPPPPLPRWTEDIHRRPIERLVAAVALLDKAGDSSPAWNEALQAAADSQRWDALADLAAVRLQEYPEDVALRFERATALMRMRSWAQAAAELRLVLAKQPEHQKAWHNLALAQQALGQVADARDTWSRLLELSPASADARARRGEAAMDMQDWGAAVPDFARLVRENPDDIAARMNLSMALRELDRLDEAVAAAEPILEGFPAHLPALNRLAELNWFLYLKEPTRQMAARERALSYCRRALAISQAQQSAQALQSEILSAPSLHE